VKVGRVDRALRRCEVPSLGSAAFGCSDQVVCAYGAWGSTALVWTHACRVGRPRNDKVARTRYFGRLAQRESTALTTQGSLVRTQHRPLNKVAGQRVFSVSLRIRTYVQGGAKSTENPTSEVSFRCRKSFAWAEIQQIQRDACSRSGKLARSRCTDAALMTRTSTTTYSRRSARGVLSKPKIRNVWGLNLARATQG
jgi:hypothetical protein